MRTNLPSVASRHHQQSQPTNNNQPRTLAQCRTHKPKTANTGPICHLTASGQTTHAGARSPPNGWGAHASSVHPSASCGRNLANAKHGRLPRQRHSRPSSLTPSAAWHGRRANARPQRRKPRPNPSRPPVFRAGHLTAYQPMIRATAARRMVSSTATSPWEAGMPTLATDLSSANWRESIITYGALAGSSRRVSSKVLLPRSF